MRKRAFSFIATAAITLCSSLCYAVPNSPRIWESVKSDHGVTEARVVARGAEIEVRAGSGVIYVTTSQPLSIKVFTILGQTVAQDVLPQGTSQLVLGTHGVFIVKAGDTTFKVAV